MITTKEQQFIKKYVDNRFYDQEKLIKYLEMHEVVQIHHRRILRLSDFLLQHINRHKHFSYPIFCHYITIFSP